MAQSIRIANAVYSDVPAIEIPKSTSGIALFTDVTPTTATDSDVASGKIYFKSDGSQSTGTASGGGGTSPWHKLITPQENAVSTTSTSSGTAFSVSLGADAYNKNQIIWVHIRDKAGKRDGYFYGSDAFFINYQKANGGTSTLTVMAIETFRYSGTTFTGYAGQYGVYGYSISNTGLLTVRRRYSSSYSLTINGTYVTNVYALDLPDNLTLF